MVVIFALLQVWNIILCFLFSYLPSCILAIYDPFIEDISIISSSFNSLYSGLLLRRGDGC